MNLETTTPKIDALRANDDALNAMKDTVTNPEDVAAFNDLINEQRDGYREVTKVEVKDADTGEVSVEVARGIGKEALSNPAMAVHSEGWKTEEK